MITVHCSLITQVRISAKQYAQALFDLTDGKSKAEIEKSVADFACHLNSERKLKIADKIMEQFGKIYNKENGIVEAEVTTREKISESLEKKVNQFVKEKYETKEVLLKNIVDENVRGGMIIRVGDEVIDGSIAGKLTELKKILVR